MTPELKELWAKASPDSVSRYDGKAVPLYPALAEFAALIADFLAAQCEDEYEVVRLRDQAKRWRGDNGGN